MCKYITPRLTRLQTTFVIGAKKNYFCLLATELLEPGHAASEAKNIGFISS
jgi:hypothetical protein